MLWERAAQSAAAAADFTAAVRYADHAHDYTRSSARTGRPPEPRPSPGARCAPGRHAEARERLTAAVEILRAEPDTDTVRALEELAALEVFAGSPDADRLTAEALILGQALGVGSEQLAGLFLTRGIYLFTAGRRPEGVAYFREGARLATQSGDNVSWDRALLNLGNLHHRPGIRSRSRAHRRRAFPPRR